MYEIKIGLPQQLFTTLRSLSPRLVRRFNVKLTTKVLPVLQQDLRDFVQEPPAVVHPFEFGTAKSRRWYFANRVPKGSRGGSYARTHALIQAWTLKITRQSDVSYFVVSNPIDISKYVYGLPFIGLHLFQRQIPGHLRTGWGKDFRVAMALIGEHGADMVRETWRETVQEEIRS